MHQNALNRLQIVSCKCCGNIAKYCNLISGAFELYLSSEYRSHTSIYTNCAILTDKSPRAKCLLLDYAMNTMVKWKGWN